MTTYLRYLGGRRIGGIIIAFTDFTRKDAFGNYWTRDTDFAFQRYNVRPLYYQHKGNMVEAAHIQASDLEVRDAGVYMECDVLDNEAGNACLELIKHNRGYYSSGVMPGSWREDGDGWIEFWPFVEVSVTDRPATRNGLTRAGVVRSFLNIAGEGDEFLRRAIMPDGDNGTGTPPAVVVEEEQNEGADVVTREEFDTLTQSVRTIADGVTQLLNQEPPTRSLEPGQLPEVLRPPQPQVQVGHRYDDMTILGLAAWTNLRMNAANMSQHTPFSGDQRTEAIRALQAKIEKQRRVDDRLSDLDLVRGSVRMIDSQVVSDWGKHIRANEAMGSTYATYGDELVPTLLNSVLYYYFMLETRVLSSLSPFQMPSQPYDWPVVTAGTTVRAVGTAGDQADYDIPNSPYPTDKITTGKVTFNAGKIGIMVLADEELFEDSAVSVAEMWARQLMRDMASKIDWCLLNGDESATVTNISHYGTDPTATAYDAVLKMDGLRHIAFANSDTAATATIGVNSGITIRKLMGARGKLGLNPSKLVHIVDPGVYWKLLELTAIESVADVGAQATLLTGQVGQLKGVPLVVADELENTNVSGQIEDSHDATLGSHLTINRDIIRVGWRRDVRMDLTKVPHVDGYVATTSARLDVQGLEAGGVAYGYNATV